MSDESAFFPAGLTAKQQDLVRRLAEAVDPATPRVYLEEARLHLLEVESEQAAKPEINLRLASVIYSTFEEVVEKWERLPAHSHSFICASMRYFASFQDEVHDFDSALGFEDDVEVLNACLELAGLTDFQIDPAHFDLD